VSESSSRALPPFDANDYRKRVLAAVEKRGGPDASDPFELYDLPPVDDLDDAAVAERVAEVWGAWQRQRDHPKYRVLVALLVEQHADRSAELLDAGRRRLAAARVRAQRAQRDSQRYELLDAAISRLVQRHGGIPADKVEGLYEVGALAGLSRAEVGVRLRRHRMLPSAAPAAPSGQPGIGPERRRQVRALLDEFGRLTGDPAPPTLLALLGLGPDTTAEQVRAMAGAWRARARELPPERLRAVVDELLVHVAELIEPGRAAVDAYLDAVAADVTEHLRPRVRAAVLVEDRLVAEDRAHLLDEAVELGLDRRRAATVIAALAEELGVTVDGNAPAPARGPAPAPAPHRRPAWEEPLKAARAALRAGRPTEAQRLVKAAEQHAADGGATRVRAVADEIAAALAAAGTRWRAAARACEARRWSEAVDHLEQLRRTAADVKGPRGEAVDDMLKRARAGLDRAERAVAAAVAGPAADRARALLAVLADCPGHPGATAALAQIPIAAPAWVSAARDARGDVLVLWAASATPEVTYRVSRQRPDGKWQVLGRTDATSMDDGGAPVGVDVPVYAVVALQAGRASEETRSDAVQSAGSAAASPTPPSGPRPPRDVRAVRVAGGTVRVSWTGSGDVEYRVRSLTPDGRWRVVGRTRALDIEDGGAPPAGPVQVYAVSAAANGERSAEARSDGVPSNG
jgi:cell division septum initiation protein DivIVA